MAGDEDTIQFTTDDDWLDETIRREPGPASLRLRLADVDDAEGHLAAVRRHVTVLVETDDDTEGHAISLHFPSAQEAEAFRKRLLITGVLAGTVALGAAGGYALSSVQPDAAGTAAGAAAGQLADANSDIGLMDASGAFAVGASVAQPADADDDIGVMDASGALTGGGRDNADEPPEPVVGPR
ncbi:MAG: hypothetical protein ACRDFY_00575 [Candidatus Limnocylindria bacterium]